MDSIQLVLDENNLITEISVVGTIDGGVDYSGELPEGFIQNFKSNFYMLKDDTIIKNTDYSAPKEPEFGSSQQDKINAQLMLSQAKQKEAQDKFNAQILLQLAGGNA